MTARVKSRRQAIAIALHEAGASNQEPAARNRETLQKTKAKERAGKTAEAERDGKAAQDRTMKKAAAKSTRGETVQTKAELYAEAKSRNIPGRSRMDKGELQRALGR